MRKTHISLIALLGLAVSTSLLTGCGRKAMLNVNGEKISKDEFVARLERVPVQTPQGQRLAGQYVVQQMISEKLVTQMAKKEGVEPTDAQVNERVRIIKKTSGDIRQILAQQGKTEDEWKDEVRSQLALNNLLAKGVTIPDADVKKAYDQARKANPSPFVRPEQVRISAIITAEKTKIDQAYNMLKTGKDFAAVAASMSEDPTAKQTNGILGWVSRDMKMVPQSIRDTAFSLGINKYSSPIKADNKWVIVKADQKRPMKVQQYNDVKDLIKEQMAVQKGAQTGTFREDMQKFIKSANITVNAERYKGIPDELKKQADKAMELQAGNTSAQMPKK